MLDPCCRNGDVVGNLEAGKSICGRTLGRSHFGRGFRLRGSVGEGISPSEMLAQHDQRPSILGLLFSSMRAQLMYIRPTSKTSSAVVGSGTEGYLTRVRRARVAVER